MSLDTRFFCDSPDTGLVTTRVDCAFKPAETKRMFFVKKGFSITEASTNLNDPTFWEAAIAAGDIIPIPDGVFVDVATNYQEGTVGIKTIKISDGETAFSFQGSFVSCFVNSIAALESNNSAYDMFLITAIPEMIGKYDADADIIYPIVVNSIDVRSKPLATDGTDTVGIMDTVIVRYTEAQSKAVKYFDLSDTVANLSGLREVLIEPISNTATELTLKIVTKCEGIDVNDLSDATDITITDSATGVELVVSAMTSQGGGMYLVEADYITDTVYDIGIPSTASNNESFTSSNVTYTAE